MEHPMTIQDDGISLSAVLETPEGGESRRLAVLLHGFGSAGDRVHTVQAAAALNEEAGEMTVFVINADAEEEQELTLDVRGFEGWQFVEHIEMYAEDPAAQNTWEHPDRILPCRNAETRAEKGVLTAHLKKESWNVLRFKK